MSTKQKRLLELSIKGIGSPLYLTELMGHEVLAQPFEYTLNLLSTNVGLSAQALLGQSATVKIQDGVAKPQVINGIIQAFMPLKVDAAGMRHYQLQLKPWLSLLNHVIDCKIFQHMSVPEIAVTLFKQYNLHEFDVSHLTQTYLRRDYCVQYNESALDFMQRLWAEEGIYYYFKHMEDTHQLILLDGATSANTQATELHYADMRPAGQHVYAWQHHVGLTTQSISQRSYQISQPAQPHEATAILPTQSRNKFKQTHMAAADLNQAQLTQLVHRQAQAEKLAQQTLSAKSTYRHLYPGVAIAIKDVPLAYQQNTFYVSSIKHVARDFSHQSGVENTQEYYNELQIQPIDRVFVLQQTRFKPSMCDLQTAIVVGPKQQQIYTDKQGRVKVQFHWDRDGKYDEDSSCWLRVKQTWAGKEWGSQFIPRVGQEVLIDFIEGDPDQPIVVGVVPNHANMPAFPVLPLETHLGQTRSGIKTHTLNANDPNAGNILAFEDKPNAEQLIVQAQRDLHTRVNQNSYQKVNQDAVTCIQQGQAKHTVEGDYVVQSDTSIHLVCGQSEILIDHAGIQIKSATVSFD